MYKDINVLIMDERFEKKPSELMEMLNSEASSLGLKLVTVSTRQSLIDILNKCKQGMRSDFGFIVVGETQDKLVRKVLLENENGAEQPFCRKGRYWFFRHSGTLESYLPQLRIYKESYEFESGA